MFVDIGARWISAPHVDSASQPQAATAPRQVA